MQAFPGPTTLLRIAIGLVLGCALLLASPMHAAEGNPPRTAARDAAPVVIDGSVLFRVAGTDAMPATQRARSIAGRIEAIAADPKADPSALRTEASGPYVAIMMGSQRLLLVADEDATLADFDSAESIAPIWAERIRLAIGDYRADRTPEALRTGAIRAALATVGFAVGVWLLVRLRRIATGWLDRRLATQVTDLEVQGLPILHAEQISRTVRVALRTVWALAVVLLAFVWLDLALSRFVWTRPFAEGLVALVLEPLERMGASAVDALPGLAFIAVLAVVVWWLLRIGALVFDALGNGAIQVAGFEPEWAQPTFRIVRTMVLLFAIVVAYPYLPGSSSDAFKGVSVFVGLLLSLGAASMVGNLIAGYTMIYRRAFRVGDRIRVADHVGDVTQIRAMVTHLRTVKNEEVVVPNSRLLGESVVNYSTLARQAGLILHTTVGIGYETPWRQVEAMLLLAAGRTPGVLAEPPPFVLQTSLGDFCIVYELNVHVADPRGMDRVYSDLHRHILDVFNEHGVAIMTPAYVADPADAKLVPPARWYEPPARRPAADGQRTA
jgi:small-conductance mechanosensitive channel